MLDDLIRTDAIRRGGVRPLRALRLYHARHRQVGWTHLLRDLNHMAEPAGEPGRAGRTAAASAQNGLTIRVICLGTTGESRVRPPEKRGMRGLRSFCCVENGDLNVLSVLVKVCSATPATPVAPVALESQQRCVGCPALTGYRVPWIACALSTPRRGSRATRTCFRSCVDSPP